jgi:putative protease
LENKKPAANRGAIRRPELLAPAGNMEKLRIAIHYGANAVYLGGKSFGLRNLADNFTIPELAEAVGYAHDRQVKVYLTVNAYPNNADLPLLLHFLEDAAAIPFDAYIAADPGVIDMIREVSPEIPIHLSTQANTTNWRSALFWQKHGIGRINLAREMSLDEMREVRKRSSIELEAFVHGAMCISYSGRCLLSSVMAERNANRGECAHPCRWSYSLVEEKRPGEYFPVMEDATGTFIFNSKDLCLLQYLPQLVGSGIDSLKIEGRMKGIHYLASVVRVYSEALDRFLADPVTYRCQPEWLEELGKISHRGYTTGFLLGPPRDVDLEYHSRYRRSHDFVGIVAESHADGATVIAVRNRMEAGDALEFIGRGMTRYSCILGEMSDEKGEPLQVANPNQRIRVRLPFQTEEFDIIRREKK